jgi:hypothetical protein
MFAIAPFVGVNLSQLESVGIPLAHHEAEFDGTSDPSKRRDLEKHIKTGIEILATVHKRLEATVT